MTSQCYAPAGDEPEPAADPPAARNGFVTFASLNKLVKASPPAVAAWARVLHAVPNSRMILLVLPGDYAAAWPRGEFARHGIGPERLMIVPRQPREQYLGLFHHVDVALDPWPYNGHTTTIDGLWMGVPAVALAGDRRAARVSAAILRLLRLDNLVARDADDYVAIVARLAADLPRLADLRRTLRDGMRASPLTDGPGLARRLEVAYRGMWRRWCASGG